MWRIVVFNHKESRVLEREKVLRQLTTESRRKVLAQVDLERLAHLPAEDRRMQVESVAGRVVGAGALASGERAQLIGALVEEVDTLAVGGPLAEVSTLVEELDEALGQAAEQATNVDDLAAGLHTSPEVIESLARKLMEVVQRERRGAGDIPPGAPPVDPSPPVEDDDPTIAERYGPAPSPEQLREIHARQAARTQDTIDRVAARSLTRTGAAKRLGVSAQSISDKKNAGALSAIRRGREFLFPTWQFHDDAPVPGLTDVIAAWPGSPVALADWAEHPAPDLGGRTPAQALAAGDVNDVLLLVESIAAATW